MKLARYMGGGRIAIVDEPVPACPPDGLLVKTEASGLCSGELMDWYMDRKVPHVLGHECAGIVAESQDERFPVGSRIFAHHHAPCLSCDRCQRGLYVHCDRWKRTKLIPGGMAQFFAVSTDNLTDTLRVDDLRSIDAALIEPLGCVVKSLRRGGIPAPVAEADSDRHYAVPELRTSGNRNVPATAVVGLGAMGLMHMLLVGDSIGYDLNDERSSHAVSLGLDARPSENYERADVIIVCPGAKAALDFAISIANPGASIVLFAPVPPGGETPVNLHDLYFKDIKLINTYSCGPDDTRIAAEILRSGGIRAEQVVSDFITIDELPEAYLKMKRGDILKPMVVFEH
ncbi:MAG: alcohol dehydrogenase catalytic domain-containing protein [Fimbriimonadales bacterium]